MLTKTADRAGTITLGDTLTGFVIGNLGVVFFGAFNIRLQLRGLGDFAALKAA
jgi:hypothetical protein